MAYGMTNSGGNATYKASQALTVAREAKTIADEAKEAAEHGGVPVDRDSTITFSLGCDANGVYMTIPGSEENEGGSEA